MPGQKFYRSLAEFEREEIKPHMKAGWCFDDLLVDALLPYRQEEHDELAELDFEPPR